MVFKEKIYFKKALEKLDGTFDKKELYRILKVSEKLGIEWGTRNMYGGGIEVQVNDNVDTIATISIYENILDVSFLDVYFEINFKPSEIIYYNEEQLAEIRNEEILYGYEMEHFKIVRHY
jgi:hypothetical protein